MPPKPSAKRRTNVVKKLAFSLLITSFFFLLAEGALALFGVGKESSAIDSFAGFSNQHPLFVAEPASSDPSRLRTATNKLVWFNDQSFTAKKAEGTRRVFCVGGSTTFGRPYDDATSFCGWLRELLPFADDTVRWEVINAGGVSYASYRVASVMEELAQYDPDLFIVYTGQNEFLERRTYAGIFGQSETQRNLTASLSRTRTFNAIKCLFRPEQEPGVGKAPSVEGLSGEVNEMLNHTVGPADYHRDDQWHDEVVKHFEANLHRMSKTAKQAGAEILFVVPASNEKDCSPFKSELDPKIAKSQQELFYAEFATRSKLSAEERLHLLEDLQSREPGFADVDYELGKAYLDAMHLDQAKSAFQRALDHDVCPLRATTQIQSGIRSFAALNKIAIVDFDKRLRQLCQQEYAHTILGEEYFLDHVHPTIQTHQKLALWILDVLQEDDLIAKNPIKSADIDQVNRSVLANIDDQEQGVALRNLAKVLHWSGKFSEAAPRAQDALARLPDDPESLLILADCTNQTSHGDLDQLEEAVAIYDQLLDAAPMYSRAYLPFGELLFDLKQYERAETVLSVAVLALAPDSPNQTRAQYFLGVTYLMLHDYQQAESLLSNVDKIYPDDPSTLLFLAQAKAGLGEIDIAANIYRRMLKWSPEDTDVLNRLGLLLLKSKQPEKATKHFKAILELEPDNADAAANLEVARQIVTP